MPFFPYSFCSFQISEPKSDVNPLSIIKSELFSHGLIAATYDFPLKILKKKKKRKKIKNSLLKDIIVQLNPLVERTLNSKEVKISILDSGISSDAMQRYSIVNMYDAMSSPVSIHNPNDNDSHGSLVAHIIKSITKEISNIYPIRITSGDQEESGSIETLMLGLAYSIDMLRVDIVNISASIRIDDSHFCMVCGNSFNNNEAYIDAKRLIDISLSSWSKRALILSASGNKPGNLIIPIPASCPEVLAVGASTGKGCNRYSLYKKSENIIFAPGGSAKMPFNYNSEISGYGTSFSCAVASAVSACHLASFPCEYSHIVPIEALKKHLFNCSSSILLPNKNEGKCVLPFHLNYSDNYTIRDVCDGYCDAYDDIERTFNLYRGKSNY